ncbi:hypothetical protein HPP92_024567 [Vanilla planifolia]|uniref:SP-RING-type domain-containing protein n=1 Tax=Vanilla planifolia TaxID=51239 RepID=A0A835UBM9_VANPL|nr:hypothetical protein HPP92_024567 [Vanilla planifolia]
MASTSAPHSSRNSAASRMATAASNLCFDNQSLIAEIRKSLNVIKGIAVDLEKSQQSDKVKQLENTVLELLVSYDHCNHLLEAIHNVGKGYQPSDELTNFGNLLENEIAKLKQASPFCSAEQSIVSSVQGGHMGVAASNVQGKNEEFEAGVHVRGLQDTIARVGRMIGRRGQCGRGFADNVHHEGQPMPGEEQEDIVMTSTQNNLLNMTCPLTGKPVTQLENPVRCMDCKHIYEKNPIMHYIKTQKPQARCPVAGCPKILQEERVLCDPLLTIEIDEIRASDKPTEPITNVDDFTETEED